MRPSASSSAGRRSFQGQLPDRSRPEAKALDVFAAAEAKRRKAYYNLHEWKERANWAEKSVHDVNAAIEDAKAKLDEMALEEGKKISVLDLAHNELQRSRRDDDGSEATREALAQAESQFTAAHQARLEATADRARAAENHAAQKWNRMGLVQRQEQQAGELAKAQEAYDSAAELATLSKTALNAAVASAGPSGLPRVGASSAIDTKHRIPGSDKVSGLHEHYQEARDPAALSPPPNKISRTEKKKSPSLH